jgi:hypothetical protein
MTTDRGAIAVILCFALLTVQGKSELYDNGTRLQTEKYDATRFEAVRYICASMVV